LFVVIVVIGINRSQPLECQQCDGDELDFQFSGDLSIGCGMSELDVWWSQTNSTGGCEKCQEEKREGWMIVRGGRR
jgi:hypothetical protein